MTASKKTALHRKIALGLGALVVSTMALAGASNEANAKVSIHLGFGVPVYGGYGPPVYNPCGKYLWKYKKTGKIFWKKKYHQCLWMY